MQVNKKINQLSYFQLLSLDCFKKDLGQKSLFLSWNWVTFEWVWEKFFEQSMSSEFEFEKHEFFASLWIELLFVSASWVYNQWENIWMNFKTRSKQSKQRRHRIFYVANACLFLKLEADFSNNPVKFDFCSLNYRPEPTSSLNEGIGFFHNFSRV